VIAVDTNILVYAHRAGVPQHEVAVRVLRDLAAGQRPWALPFPCIGQFLRVVTHAVFRPQPTTMATALRNLDMLLASPTTRVLLPTERHVPVLRDVLIESGALGGDVYDAQIAALCVEHGVEEILTADRGFRRFTGLKVTDPFR
jgi:toxin-antitoxin system PIN domain toxin